MASLSDDLKLVLLSYGEEGYGGFANYGDVENANWEIVEDKLGGQSAITVTTTDVTLTDAQQQTLHLNLSGALTGNRSIVLKASQKGLFFVTNGTTGAYTITIKPSAGTGVVLDQGKRAWIYSDGSAASFIVKIGDLLGEQDVATDANLTLTWGTDAETIRHTGTLTADRAVTLSTTGAVKGARWRIVRTGSGFNLNVGTGPLKALVQNTWAEFVYDGTAWFLAEYGVTAFTAIFSANGMLARTAADTFAARTITGTAAQITVTNGDGVSGNPTLSLPADVLIPTVLTVPNTGLHLLDTNASHDVILKPGSDVTADRTVTIVTGDADRTLDLTASTTGKFESALLHVADEKTTGTNGGASTSGTWSTRTLNTVRTNEIASASLSSNQISLPAGTYYIEARAPAAVSSGHKARLYNVTDAAAVLYGSSAFVGTSSATTTDSFIVGRFTLAGTKSLRIEHNVNAQDATQGFGKAVSASVAEIYTEAMIWKVA